MLLRAEEAAAELCERVEDEVRRVVEATLHRSLYIQRAAARTRCVLLLLVYVSCYYMYTYMCVLMLPGCANSMCPTPTRICVLLLYIYLYVCPNATTNTEVGRVEARLRELDMSSYYVCVLLLYLCGWVLILPLLQRCGGWRRGCANSIFVHTTTRYVLLLPLLLLKIKMICFKKKKGGAGGGAAARTRSAVARGTGGGGAEFA